jgi:hypothetical protein
MNSVANVSIYAERSSQMALVDQHFLCVNRSKVDPNQIFQQMALNNHSIPEPKSLISLSNSENSTSLNEMKL